MKKEINGFDGINLGEGFSAKSAREPTPKKEDPFLVVTNMMFDENTLTGQMKNIRTLSDIDFQAVILDRALKYNAEVDFVEGDIVILQASESVLTKLEGQYKDYASTALIEGRSGVDYLKEVHEQQKHESQEDYDLRQSVDCVNETRQPH